MENPNCPKCGKKILPKEFCDTWDEGADTIFQWYGICKSCNTEFGWLEHYTHVKTDHFEPLF